MNSRKKIKILYILTQSEWGGAQKYVFDLVEHLPRETFEIVVASGKSESSELIHKLTAKHIATHRLSSVQRSINPFLDIGGIIELYHLIKKIKPDVVHLNSSKVSVIGSIAAFMAKTPRVIYTAHGWVFNEPNSFLKNTLYYLAEFITAKLKDDIICVSEFDKKIAQVRKISPRKKLVTIHNGIDVNKLNFYDADTARELLAEKIVEELPSHRRLIGTIGNLYKTKGHEYLIEAMKKIPDKTCIILGEGPQRKNLEQLISENNLKDKVLLPGAVINAHQYLKAFDVFVLPSVKEGFPYIILEALAAKLPIIATSVGGIPEVVSQKNLIQPRDNEALVKALSQTKKAPAIAIKSIAIKDMITETISLYK
jgi:glycosyltransferase involved in cell wall biosynthesis